MDLILNIHTTTETALISISNGLNTLSFLENNTSKEHAGFVHSAIKKILQENDIEISALKAVAVTHGPGSYTGIRIGLSTAKGIAFSLKIPVITLSTLEVMALSAIKNIDEKDACYCPMIDARRMEVYTACYTHDLSRLTAPSAMVLDETSFSELKQYPRIFFFGSGSQKLQKILPATKNFTFTYADISAQALAFLSTQQFKEKKFKNSAAAQPFYLKDFYSPSTDSKK